VLIGCVVGGLQLAVPWHSLGWLIVLALSSGIVGWMLITSSLPYLPARLSSLLLLLEPTAALLLAAVILGERPDVAQISGAVLVCGMLFVAAKDHRADTGNVSVAHVAREGPR
jgi:drug/metabolite transporter (DMT)-like permease